MNLEEEFDKRVEKNFDIKKKRISILENYGENFQKNNYITNPAIAREEEIKKLKQEEDRIWKTEYLPQRQKSAEASKEWEASL
mgnify:CR=1 FL=1